MKDLSAMTAAELVTKHNWLFHQVRELEHEYANTEIDLSDFVDFENRKEELAALTTELENRCEDWQMKIDSMGSLFVSPRKAKTTIMGKGMNWRENSQEMEVVISDAAEFHALVGYLIAKGGKG